MIDVGFPTGYERVLPPTALRMVRDRRRTLLARATGHVLDLGGCEAHVSLLTGASSAVVLETSEEHGERLARRAAGAPVRTEVRAGTIADLDRAGARFDTIVSVLQLARADDLAGTLRHAVHVLEPHGRLLVIEPTVAAGWAARVQRVADPFVKAATGRHAVHDIPGALRTAGLYLDDCERVSVPSTWPNQWFVVAEAFAGPGSRG